MVCLFFSKSKMTNVECHINKWSFVEYLFFKEACPFFLISAYVVIIIHSGKPSKWTFQLPASRPTDWLTGSVYDLRVSVVALQVGEDVVGVPAAEVAKACLDPQHLPAEGGAVGAAELHLHRLGLVGDAAAFVCAHAAVLGPEGPGAGAAWDGEVGGALLTVDVQAFFPRLSGRRNKNFNVIKLEEGKTELAGRSSQLLPVQAHIVQCSCSPTHTMIKFFDFHITGPMHACAVVTSHQVVHNELLFFPPVSYFLTT